VVMARYALCSVCGRGTRINRARTCTYCGRYVCRKHRTNGLCPTHVNIMSKEHADALLVQDHIHHWIGRITIPILLFSFIMSFGIIGQQSRILGFVSLGIFLVTLLLLIAVNRSSSKKHEEILRKAIHSEISDIETTLCINCIIALPEGTKKCPNCGKKVSIVPGNPFQDLPATITISAEQYTQPLQQYTQSTPPPAKTEYETLPPPPTQESQQQFKTPQPPVKTEHELLPPPPPPLEKQQVYKTPPPPEDQQVFKIPPPPPGYKPHQHDGNQDLDSLLNEIVEETPDTKLGVTTYLYEDSNSGLHVCSSCGKRFTMTDSTNSCPFCNIPLFNTR